jgi:hypothetical protein
MPRGRRMGGTCAFCSEPTKAAIAGVPIGDRCLATVRAIAHDAGTRVRVDQPKRTPLARKALKVRNRPVEKTRSRQERGQRPRWDGPIMAVCRCGAPFDRRPARRGESGGRMKAYCSKRCQMRYARQRHAAKRRAKERVA